MGRKPREFYPGALYHIVQRGNNRNYIYENIQDKKMFFELLMDAQQKFDFHILYYVLMDNHYHLILEAGDTSVSKAIQRLNTAYSRYYNKKYNRSGTIYGGRYSSTRIKDAKYFFQLLKYIANNPVKAEIVNNPEEYRWSAHPSIKNNDRSIVEIEKTLSYFPSPKTKAKEDYINLIEKDLEIKSDYGMAPVKESQKLSDSLDYILISLEYKEETIVKIKQGDKRRDIKAERDRFIKKAHESGFKIQEIADHISFSYEGVRKVVRFSNSD